MWSSIFSLSLGCLCLFLTFVPAWGNAASSTGGGTAEQHMVQGLQSFQRGHFEQAIASWREAVRLSAKAQQFTTHSMALTHLGQAYQALGQSREAMQHLQKALQLAQRLADPTQVAIILARLGDVHVGMRATQAATRHLDDALQLARTLGHAGLLATILHTRGNLLMSQQQPQVALHAYQESAVFARQAGAPLSIARALTHAAMAAVQSGHYQAAVALLDEAQQQLHSAAPTHDKAYELLNIGLALHQLRPHLDNAAPSLLLRAAQQFHDAAVIAENLGDLRAASYAWGYLGMLYLTEARYQEALPLTRRALHAAQQVQAPEALYLWQWQTGRLLKALGEMETARVAYRHAVETLQSIRTEVPQGYGRAPAPFRETLGPLYFERLDLLLRQAAVLQDRAQDASTLLEEARHTIKQFKTAELRDYFRDECVDAAKTTPIPIEQVSPTAAIIYPILLPDRSELLVSLPSQGLKRFVVPVRTDELTRVVKAFREALSTEGSEAQYKNPATHLYTWLIRPLEPDLTSENIQTLVFVPDGPLRTLPWAALYDGAQFLIKKYAVAVAPGLDLIDPRPLSGDKLQMLAAGVSVAVQGHPPLPHVEQELAELQRHKGVTVLHNQIFSLANLEATLRTREFDIVHLASHGKFASNVEQSFVLTYDSHMTLNQLEQVVGRLRLRDKPLGLLTLSACETAQGDDDRAALGLAGVAIKAGASSALATLWKVQDEATSLLVTTFYQHLLQHPAISRAAALQRAQGELLNHPKYKDPFFWAGFLLINNWL